MHIKSFMPVVIFMALAFLFWFGLNQDPRRLPSALINKPAPVLAARDLYNLKWITNKKIFIGQVTLLNVFASWCSACEIEHPILVDIAGEHLVKLVGIDYKDDRNQALAWLLRYGNPFSLVAFDETGRTALNYGVYGTPESFIIDKKGLIRYKHIGPITHEIWKNKMYPLVVKLTQG